MSKTTTPSRRRHHKAGRRHPLATVALIAIGLMMTGGAYAAINAGTATADTELNSQVNIDEGEKLFQANCATCHGMNADGAPEGPSLIGVGAASVDFQVGTGRMPMAMQGPQAPQKPVQFTDLQVKQLAVYVGSLAPGPSIPDAQYLKGDGDLANGGELFRINCAMCHNVAAAGGALTQGKYAPPLAGVSAVHKYEAMLTGPQNMPVFNDMVLTPTEKNDVISYLQHLEFDPAPGGFGLGSIGPVSEGLFLWIFGLGSIVGLTIWITARSN